MQYSCKFMFPSSSIRLLVGIGLLTSSVAAPQAISVKDLKGRTVSLPQPARRILIDDGRYLIALSLIHPDPVSILAAWPRDINRIGAQAYDKFLHKFPRIAEVPQVASSASTFSLEKVLAVRPEVAVFSLGPGPSDEDVRQCEAAGIKVVFIDFFSHPFQNLEPSLTILGRITGRDAQAKSFIEFRRARIDKIASALKSQSAERPKVFLEAHAGMSGECCNSPGKGNTGDYISFVGGHNIGADVIPGTFGKLNVEYVVSQNPKVYIATGGPHLEKTGGFVIGPGYTIERSRASLAKVAERPAVALLPAVREGRVYGLSHQLLNSPLDILALEAMARWIRPELFSGLDPVQSMAEINKRFLAVPLEGTYWISLR